MDHDRSTGEVSSSYIYNVFMLYNMRLILEHRAWVRLHLKFKANDPSLQIRVCNQKLIFLFFNQNICSGADSGFLKKGFICIKVCVCVGGGGGVRFADCI